jgi:hypothetical protein
MIGQGALGDPILKPGVSIYAAIGRHNFARAAPNRAVFTAF